jgi:hypothetical protein
MNFFLIFENFKKKQFYRNFEIVKNASTKNVLVDFFPVEEKYFSQKNLKFQAQ